MTKLTFYIVRHGKTLMNTLDMVQGWCDSPLTDEGKNVAIHLGHGLKDIHFRAAYCSTLSRTHETAELVLKTKGQDDLPIMAHDGFKEACFGSFEGGPNKTMWGNAALFLQFVSLEEMNEAVFSKKISQKQVLDTINKLDTMGLAEDYETLRKRTQSALKEVAEEEAKKGEANILVIAHGMSILGMLGSLGGYELLKKPLDNASVSKVIYQNGKFTIESMGDMSYVEKGKVEVSK